MFQLRITVGDETLTIHLHARIFRSSQLHQVTDMHEIFKNRSNKICGRQPLNI